MNKFYLTAFLIIFCEHAMAQEPHLVIPALHKAPITSVVFLPGDKYIVSASSDNTAIIWEIGTNKQFNIIRPSQSSPYTESTNSKLSLSPNSKNFIVCNSEPSGFGTTGPMVCSVDNSQPIGYLDHTITRAEYTPDGKYIVGGNYYSTLFIYNASDASLLHTYNNVVTIENAKINMPSIGATKKDLGAFENKMKAQLEAIQKESEKHLSEIKSLACSKDGLHVVTTYENNTVVLWNINTGTRTILKGTDEGVNGAEFSPDGSMVVVSSVKLPKVYDVKTCNILYRFSTTNGSGIAMFSLPNPGDPHGGKYIVTAPSSPGKGAVSVWNAKNGLLVKNLDDDIYSKQVIFSPDGKQMAELGSQKLYTRNGITFDDALNNNDESETASFSEDGKLLVTATSNTIEIWNTKTLENIDSFKGYDGNPNDNISPINASGIFPAGGDLSKLASMSSAGDAATAIENTPNTDNQTPPDNNNSGNSQNTDDKDDAYLMSLDKKYKTEITDVQTTPVINIKNVLSDKIAYSYKPDSKTYYSEIPQYSPNSKLVAISNINNRKIEIVNLATGKIINTIPAVVILMSGMWTPDSKYLLIASDDARYKKLYKPAALHTMPKSLTMSEMVTSGMALGSAPLLVDAITGEGKARMERGCGFSFSAFFSPPCLTNPAGGKYLVTIGLMMSRIPTVNIFETQTGKFIFTTNGDVGNGKILFSPDGKYLITDDGQKSFKQWSLATGKQISTFYPGDSPYPLQVDSAGNYAGSKEAVSQLYYVTKDFKIVSFEQLDIKNNRPDKILKELGSNDDSLINKYSEAHQERLKTAVTDTAYLNKGLSLPEIKLTNEDGDVHSNILPLHIIASDHSACLQKLNIWVNHIPYYGLRGLKLPGESKKLDTTINLPLSKASGTQNNIEVSVINITGIESYRSRLVVNNLSDGKPFTRIYFVGIGLNHYAQGNNNLQYSLNDIRALAGALNAGAEPASVIIDTLFDENVTKTNVANIKKKMADLGVDDKVIIAYAGHGMFSSYSKKYYLSTFYTDFDHPEKESITYEQLENLTDGIPARQKLMLIDACASGDYDRDSLFATDRNTLLKKNSYELMRDVFINTEMGTGTTIIASCGASGSAAENKDLQHGLFTYSILEMLTHSDKYMDFIRNSPYSQYINSINALKDYVVKRVGQLSQNTQQPLIRTENIDLNWDIKN